MQQDFLEWLKADENENTNIREEDLLLAPVNSAPQNESLTENSESAIEEPVIEEPQKIEITEPEIIESESESKIEDNEIKITEAESPEEIHEQESEIPVETQEPEKSESQIQEPPEEIQTDGNIQETWQRTAAKYDLSLDEPPIELWTRINESLDYETEDYEETESLQGDAYIPRNEHIGNFTQRLQKTLRGRKHKAEILREEEAEQKSNPRFFKTVIICSAMLIEIALMCIALFFLKQYAAVIPAKNAENTQVVEISEVSKDIKQPDQIEIVLTKGQNDIESDDLNLTVKNSEPELEPESETFESLLRAGMKAYNSKDYDTAIIKFNKAKEMRDYDIRPYIGMSEAYRAKKMYFDSKRVIDEARKKAKKNPTLDVQMKFLWRE